SQLRRPLAAAVRRGGATAGTGLTGVAVVLRLSPAPVAQTAHHQRDRALLRGSATENPTYGVLCERRKCGPHHLLHLPEIQSGMENPHPQPIYTSCLTSPRPSGTYGRGRALPCTPLYLGGVLVPEVPVLLDPSIRLAMTCGHWPPSRANNSVFFGNAVPNHKRRTLWKKRQAQTNNERLGDSSQRGALARLFMGRR